MGSFFSGRKNSSINEEEKEEKKDCKHGRRSLEEEADSLQMVLPNIYMGSAVAAKNLNLLESVGITHIVAIGWNLSKHFPLKFKYLLLNRIEDRPGYLIISKFSQCFNFMDDALIHSNIDNKNRLFVHCHKGLSRSATIIIGYEMWANKKSFNEVLTEIRENRSFIMPNIGFQAQLKKFEEKNYSLNIEKDYNDFDVIHEIEILLPDILEKIKIYYNMYKNNDIKNIDDKDLFAKTMYIHQVHKLKEKNKLNNKDINILNESIEYLRKIQIEFICDKSSISRFNTMFALK